MREGEGRQSSSVTGGVREHSTEGLLVVLVNASTEDFLVGAGQELAQGDFLSDGCGQRFEDCRGKQFVGHVDGIPFRVVTLAVVIGAREEEDEVEAVHDSSAICCRLMVNSFPQSEAGAAHWQCGLEVRGVGCDGSQEVVEACPCDGVELVEQGGMGRTLHSA